jgi:hypothetical protein
MNTTIHQEGVVESGALSLRTYRRGALTRQTSYGTVSSSDSATPSDFESHAAFQYAERDLPEITAESLREENTALRAQVQLLDAKVDELDKRVNPRPISTKSKSLRSMVQTLQEQVADMQVEIDRLTTEDLNDSRTYGYAGAGDNRKGLYTMNLHERSQQLEKRVNDGCDEMRKVTSKASEAITAEVAELTVLNGRHRAEIITVVENARADFEDYKAEMVKVHSAQLVEAAKVQGRLKVEAEQASQCQKRLEGSLREVKDAEARCRAAVGAVQKDKEEMELDIEAIKALGARGKNSFAGVLSLEESRSQLVKEIDVRCEAVMAVAGAKLADRVEKALAQLDEAVDCRRSSLIEVEEQATRSINEAKTGITSAQSVTEDLKVHIMLAQDTIADFHTTAQSAADTKAEITSIKKDAIHEITEAKSNAIESVATLTRNPSTPSTSELAESITKQFATLSSQIASMNPSVQHDFTPRTPYDFSSLARYTGRIRTDRLLLEGMRATRRARGTEWCVDEMEEMEYELATRREMMEGKRTAEIARKEWPAEWPMYWEGGDPTGLGRASTAKDVRAKEDTKKA